MTRNGLASSCVCTSTVTLRSCMHSSRPDWVFGEARLISSTRTTLAKIGPGRNSKRPSRWLKPLVPTRSAGSRSAVPCTRAKARSSERAMARASVVLPTPGRSSTSTWPSATSATSTSSSTSSRTSTARRTFPATRRMVSAASSSSEGVMCSGTLMASLPPGLRLRTERSWGDGLRAQGDDVLEDRRGDLGLARQRHVALVGGGDDRDLVGRHVEARIGARDVVEHDGVQALVAQLAPGLGKRLAPVLGGEAHEHLAVATTCGDPAEDIGRRLQRQGQPVVLGLLELGRRSFGGPEVGHRGG